MSDPHNTQATRPLDAAPPVEDTLRKGELVGRYVILDQLGVGGMGVVYQAYDPDLDRRVALKVLGTSGEPGSNDSPNSPRFLREAQALAQLSHGNVVAVHDVGVFQKHVFIAMELVKGKTIRPWLEERRRSIAEILEVFVGAGRGLAAAHDAGMAHRDFKPSNVIVGDDARVRVLDFGLARVVRGGPRAEEPVSVGAPPVFPLEAGSSSGDRLLEAPLTIAGSLLGTPAYMAPEQLLRQPATAASDQFSFCVALYEALYGERPSANGPPEKYAERVIGGRIAAAPADSKVPARLRRILLRGLSPKVEDRYPSMHALLAELVHDPWAWRRRALAVTGVAVLGGLAVFGFVANRAGAPAASTVCLGSEAALAGVWDAPRRAEVEATFRANAGPYGDQALGRLLPLLDAYAGEWTSMQTQACQATHVYKVQSEALLDLRTACLSQRREQLGALTESFARASTPDVITLAIEAALDLPRLDPCADTAALLAVSPLPDDPTKRATISTAGKAMARAEAVLDAGDADGALALLVPLVDEVAATDYPQLSAEFQYLLGRVQSRLATPDGKAETTLYKALSAAAGAHDDGLVGKIWIELIGLIGHDSSRPAEAFSLRRVAELAVVRAGHDMQLHADLTYALALVRWAQGNRDEALALCVEALGLREELHGPTNPKVADALNLQALILVDGGDYAAAMPIHQRALAVREASLGPDHPDVADTLDNMGVAYYHQGRLDDALANYQRGFAIRERVLGPQHRDVGTSLTNMGGVYFDQGKLTQARDCWERALAIWERAFGPDDAELAIVLVNLGDLAVTQGEFQLGLDRCQRALKLDEKVLEQDNPSLAYDLTCMGAAWNGLGKPRLALPVLERSLTLRQGGEEPLEFAKTKFVTAQTLWASGGDRGRAQKLAREAEALYAEAGPDAAARRDAVTAWLGRVTRR